MVKLSLDTNIKYLLAVSGGPDSMAMLDMFFKQGYDFEIAHVNYHHRKESDAEEQMIKNYGKKNNIKVNVLSTTYPDKGNFEDWARVTRYDYFSYITKEHNLDKCVVAHHLDDVLETYLMQLKRGYVSYYGLKQETTVRGVKIVRPLLKFTKNELLQYVLTNDIPYSIDVTNFDTNLLRNDIRHNLVNNMSIGEKKLMLVEIEEKNNRLNGINQVISRLLKNDCIKFDDINRLDREIKERYIFNWIKKITSVRVSSGRINDILEKLSDSKGNIWVNIKDNYYFLKEYDCLRIVEKDVYNYYLVIEKPCVVDHELFCFDLLTNPNKFYIKESDYPLTIEIVKSSDKVKIGNIKKAMNRFLIDNKIPASKRLYWPKIVNNKGEIIFVPKNSEDEEGLYVVKTK